jgi:hypothetical protein
VTKVDVYGNQDERIFVEFSHAKLATLGITPQALFDSLAKQNNVTPAGTVETSSQRVPLRVTGALDGAKAVAETPVESNGRVFRLGDIATVTHGYVDPPSFVVRQEGKAAIGIGVVTAKGANILDLGKEVEKATAEFMKAVPQGIDVKLIADQPKVVEHAVGEFVHSFMEALVIVLFVSFLALGWRTGIVVALSVPLVLGIVFIVMNTMSLDLHRITLGALIIALGLLVDDAIIAVEMMVVKMEQGWDRMRAASFRLGIYCVSDAHGNAGHGRWLPPHRLCQFRGRRICRQHLLDRGDRAGRLLVRGGDLHALYRRQAAAEHQGAPQPRSARGLRDPHVSRACALSCSGASITASRWWSRPSASSSPRSSASVMSSSSSSRCRSGPSCSSAAPARGHRLQRHREGGEEGRDAAQGRQGHRDLYRLCRPGFAALLARPQPAASERGLCRGRHRRQGRRGARAHQGQDRKCGRRWLPVRGACPCRSLQLRSAGRASPCSSA